MTAWTKIQRMHDGKQKGPGDWVLAAANDLLSRRAKRSRTENCVDEVAELERKAVMALMRLQAEFC